MKRDSKDRRKKLDMFILFFVLGMAFFAGQAISLNAQETPAGSSKDQGIDAVQNPNSSDKNQDQASVKNKVCQIEMGKFLQKEMKDYYQWIDQHFSNKSGTTSLLEDSFRRYAELRASIMQQYALYEPTLGVLQQSEGLEAGACMEQINKALHDAQKTLERKAISTSSVKKSTALLEKYQKINGQLRVLSEDFVKMKAYLTTFADKLPCYVKKSCNKG